MAAERRYTIKENRWSKALLEGMEIAPDGRIRSVLEDRTGDPVHEHAAFLPAIDCAERDGTWGRLHLNIRHDSSTAVILYILAGNDRVFSLDGEETILDECLLDPSIPVRRKIRFLKELGAIRSANHEDIALYSLSGRYLHIAVEIVGDKDASVADFCVYTQGDNFEQTFPEIYRERNGFFHRYMSIYSTIYNDFQDKIDELPKLLDIDTCPAELLPLYGSWLGIDLTGGFLPDDICRSLVKEGYQLSRRKGTKWALARIIEIVLGCEVDILEHNTMRGYLLSDGAQIPENLRGGGIYDVSILVHGKIKETLRHQLMFLLDQFKPVRTRIRLVQLSDTAVADGNTYLDMNATIPLAQRPQLDSESVVGDVLTLE